MADITQELGFDVSNALANLDALNKSVSSFNRRIGSLGRTLERFNGQAGSVSQQFDRIGGSARTSLGRAEQSTRRLTVSWQTLTRVVATQIIVKALRRVEQLFTDATRSAIEFGTKIDEIQTIANGAFGDNDRLARSVRELSDLYGSPILDTAAGLYQTISNQIGNSADEQIRFTAAAQQFAKAGVASVNDSVNLLSGTLNAYGKGVNEVNQVSSQFFRTIELGRTTASELANSFGRLVPFGTTLGVELDELQSTLAGLTIRGVKTSEAVTQLRGVMNALQKPTNDMRTALERLGFQTGDQAVKALGLVGVIRELSQTEGDFARLFTRIRGRAGAIAIANAADEFDELNQKIRETESTLAQTKFAQFIQSDAQQVSRDINRLKNIITVDLGGAILSGLAALSRFIQRVRRGFAILRGGNFAEQEEAAERLDKAYQEADQSLTAFRKQLEVDFLKAQRTAVDASRKIRQSVREISAAFIVESKNISFQNDTLVNDVEETVSRIVNARQQLVKVLQSQAEDSLRVRDASELRVFDIQQDQRDRTFEFRLKGLDDVRQFRTLLNQATKEANNATNAVSALRTNADPQAVQRALSQFDRSIQFADRARQLASQSGNRDEERRAVRRINELLNQRIRAEEQIQRVQQNRAKQLQGQAKSQQGQVDQLKAAARLLTENIRLVDSRGNPLDPRAIQEQRGRQQRALQQFRDLALSQDDLSALDVLGITRFVRDFQQDLDKTPFQLRFEVEGGINSLERQILALQARFRSGVSSRLPGLDLETLTGLTGGGQVTGPTDFNRRVDELLKTRQQAAQSQNRIQQLNAEIQRNRKLLPNFLGQLKDVQLSFNDLSQDTQSRITASGGNFANTFGLTGSDDFRKTVQSFLTDSDRAGISAIRQFNDVAASIRRVTNSGRVSEDQIVELRKQLASVATLDQQGSSVDLSSQLNRANELVNILDAIAKRQTQVSQVGSTFNLDEFQKVESILQRINAQFGRTVSLQKQVNDSLSFPAPTSNSRPPGFQNGGFNSRGKDTISAALAPGETVINPRSSRRFFSQLQAMNAGQRVGLQNGGQATSVGDITVNVNESSSARATAREVAATLRREFRRGTTKI